MIITHRYKSYDKPIYINYMFTFMKIVLDDLYTESERMNFRLFNDDGKLIGRAANYNGISYAE